LELAPQPRDGICRTFATDVSIPVGRSFNTTSLLTHLFRFIDLGVPAFHLFVGDVERSSLFNLAQVKEGSLLVLRYRSPLYDPQATYQFARSGAATRVRVGVDDDVLEVKRRILKEWQIPTTLPSCLRLSCWAVPLAEEGSFLCDGLPSGWAVEADLAEVRDIVVEFANRGQMSYRSCESDTV
jgi:hypothetical protein